MPGLAGAIAFGLTLGWALSFAAPTSAGLAYRAVAAAMTVMAAWLVAPGIWLPVLAAMAAGAALHELFLVWLRRLA